MILSNEKKPDRATYGMSYGTIEDQQSKNRASELFEPDHTRQWTSLNGADELTGTERQFKFVGTSYLHSARHDLKKGFRHASRVTEDALEQTSKQAAIEEPSGEKKMTNGEAFKNVLLGSRLNILLIFVPFGWYAARAEWSAKSIFWLNFLAMVPLAAVLGDFTEEIAAHTNQIIGGLVNASFGNLVEVIIAVQALQADEIRIVQASMLGSIFSNLLLVLGSCFFFGGLVHSQQKFNSVAAAANISLLALSSLAFVLPTPFAQYYDVDDNDVLKISRYAALFLIAMYLQLLVFQLVTHADIFEDEDEEDTAVSLPFAITGLIVVTGLLSLSSEYLVGSIDGFCTSSGISKTFVGIIILPVVGNAVEHMTAVTVATKDKMDLAMGVAIGSCTQIALFVTPVTVIYGWIGGIPMTLNFPHFEIILFVLSVIIVSMTISTPTTNWLLGALLISTYFMIAIGFWFEKVEPTVHQQK